MYKCFDAMYVNARNLLGIRKPRDDHELRAKRGTRRTDGGEVAARKEDEQKAGDEEGDCDQQCRALHRAVRLVVARVRASQQETEEQYREATGEQRIDEQPPRRHDSSRGLDAVSSTRSSAADDASLVSGERTFCASAITFEMSARRLSM